MRLHPVRLGPVVAAVLTVSFPAFSLPLELGGTKTYRLESDLATFNFVLPYGGYVEQAATIHMGPRSFGKTGVIARIADRTDTFSLKSSYLFTVDDTLTEAQSQASHLSLRVEAATLAATSLASFAPFTKGSLTFEGTVEKFGQYWDQCDGGDEENPLCGKFLWQSASEKIPITIEGPFEPKLTFDIGFAAKNENFFESATVLSESSIVWETIFTANETTIRWRKTAEILSIFFDSFGKALKASANFFDAEFLSDFEKALDNAEYLELISPEAKEFLASVALALKDPNTATAITNAAGLSAWIGLAVKEMVQDTASGLSKARLLTALGLVTQAVVNRPGISGGSNF